MAITVDHAVFRKDFPVFADAARYPEPSVSFWLGLAGKLLPENRWCDVLNFGAELFVAHNLVLERRSQDAVDNGGVPGMTTGPTSSQSAGSVSVSYDVNAGIIAGEGHWNLTTYGVRFIQLALMIGAGPIQVGLPLPTTDPLSSQNAWSGPPLGYPWSS